MVVHRLSVYNTSANIHYLHINISVLIFQKINWKYKLQLSLKCLCINFFKKIQEQRNVDILVNILDVYQVVLWTTYGKNTEIFEATVVQWNSERPTTGKLVSMNKLMLWQILKISTIQPIYTTLFALIHSFVINLNSI